MAANLRNPSPGLIHHSDRGSQYASHAYQAVLTPSLASYEQARWVKTVEFGMIAFAVLFDVYRRQREKTKPD